VLDVVGCTHPYVPTRDGAPRPTPRYTEPLAFLGERARHEVDPLESTRPDLALTDPAPAAGRRAVAAVGVGVGLNRETVDGLVIGVSEVLANAIRHGRPPVELRAWAGSDRVLVVVHDRGSGPSDPYAGYLPRRDEQAGSGLGLWITHQVCSQVTLIQSAGGFTVRLTAGAPYLPPPAPSDGRAS
jgi:anti-sigma regulatory factor (Ser/Thr protein kinase)